MIPVHHPCAMPMLDLFASSLAVLTAAEAAATDRASIAAGLSLERLMLQAGVAVARHVRRHCPPCRVLVLCGPGHNGGDGFVAARVLHESGWPVHCVRMLPAVPLAPATAAASARWERTGGLTLPGDRAGVERADLVIDAVFGTGLNRPVTGSVATLFARISAARLPVIAVDLPSGLDSDTGAVSGASLTAEATVTFGWRKPAHLLLPGKRLCGAVMVADIGLAPPPWGGMFPCIFRNAPALWKPVLPCPTAEMHKYSRGHTVVLGGATATGAARLAATAAARIGSGLVTLLVPAAAHPLYASAPASLLTRPFAQLDDARAALQGARVHAILIGPGAGVTEDIRALVLAALATGRPVVLDADALTAFAEDQAGLCAALQRNGQAVLTPHPGEFERLFPGLSARDRITAARAAAMTCGAVVVLKGNDTVIATVDAGREQVVLNDTAPPALATGGSGDVLSGMIAGLLAQGMPPFAAACAAVWLHGRAATRQGPGLTADDLPRHLPQALADVMRD